MSLKTKIYQSINNLHDEIDNANELKNKLNFDTELGEMITTETRLKLLKEFLKIFKQFKHLNYDKQKILEDTNKLTKRCKLHFYQLRKLKQSNYDDNVTYFTIIMKLIYMFCLRDLK